MVIRDLFSKDINRSINGVIKVSQSDEESIQQELSEYVVTRELQRHFAYFFENYETALDIPTDKIGVWISGFFGSGKSHFLKMLSYLLANKVVGGRAAIDYFDGKLEDEMVYSKMRRCAGVPTEAILFNIDTKGGQWKEGDTAKTALLRAFERVFFEHLGFCGEDLKLAKLEMFIESRGKTDEFRTTFEQVNGMPWVESRETYAYFEDDVVEALQSALGMSEAAARNWFNGTEDDVIAVDSFVGMVGDYAARRADEEGGRFRLLFMVDEVGQFIGDDVSLMLSLQTLVEEIGARCAGRVWVMVTSQESIDGNQLIVGDDFSKIQGRFTTRLSLSSSSVDEVIKRRVLDKTQVAQLTLQDEYEDQSAVLRNLFSFEGSRGDLLGYESEGDFVDSYPFVSYQFKVLPDVMTEIRKHGVKAKHMSTGERSMLSAFQESAQVVQGEQTTALVPFWRFFDTISKDLEHGILQVVDRATRAAEAHQVLRPEDISVLKLLYLIRYITYLKGTLNNIATLMVDDMGVDKVALRERLKASLDRLVRENYVARQGDAYNFLTDEEQDIAREISQVPIDVAEVIENIKKVLFEGIFPQRKLSRGVNNFPFDHYVDGSIYGPSQGGMKLNVATIANEGRLYEAADGEIAVKSQGQALVVLSDDADYFEMMQNVARTRKYARTINKSQLPPSTQEIIKGKMNQAQHDEKEAKTLIENAVVNARVAVNGSMVTVRAMSAKQLFETVLDKLVDSIFTKADYISDPVEGDGDIIRILRHTNEQSAMADMGSANERAVADMKTFLELQKRLHVQTTMGDIQRKYQADPYGWRDIDIAAVAAQLVAAQDATILYGGQALRADDKNMIDCLRKHADKVEIRIREKMSDALLSKARSILRDFADTSAVPEDEDKLIDCIQAKLEETQEHCQSLMHDHFTGLAPEFPYPGKSTVEDGLHVIGEILADRADGEAFLRAFNANGDKLLDFAEDMEPVDGFFPNQQRLFDGAVETLALMDRESFYLGDNEEAQQVIADMKGILRDPQPYRRVSELPSLTKKLSAMHGEIVRSKQNELLSSIDGAVEELKEFANNQDPYQQAANLAIAGTEHKIASVKSRVHSAKAAGVIDTLRMQFKDLIEEGYQAVDASVDEARAKAEREIRLKRELTEREASAVPAEARVSPKPASSQPVAARNVASQGMPQGGRGVSQSGQVTRVIVAEKSAEASPKPLKRKVLRRDEAFDRAVLTNEAEVDAYLASVRKALLEALVENDSVRLS